MKHFLALSIHNMLRSMFFFYYLGNCLAFINWNNEYLRRVCRWRGSLYRELKQLFFNLAVNYSKFRHFNFYLQQLLLFLQKSHFFLRENILLIIQLQIIVNNSRFHVLRVELFNKPSIIFLLRSQVSEFVLEISLFFMCFDIFLGWNDFSFRMLWFSLQRNLLVGSFKVFI